MTARPFTRLTKPLHRIFADRTTVNRWFRFDGPAEGDVMTFEFNPAHSTFDTEGLSMTAPAAFAWVMLSKVVAIAPERGDHLDRAIDKRDRLSIVGEMWRAESCSLVAHDLLEIKLAKER